MRKISGKKCLYIQNTSYRVANGKLAFSKASKDYLGKSPRVNGPETLKSSFEKDRSI
jgi:hypothetical protein